MTVKDFLKRLSVDDLDKMMTLHDGKGWSNIEMQRSDHDIYITHGDNSPYSDEKSNNNKSSYPVEDNLFKLITEIRK